MKNIQETTEAFKGFKAESLKKLVIQNLSVDVETLTQHGKEILFHNTEAMEMALHSMGWDLVTDWETMTHSWVRRQYD